jgi:diguanylate cyclase (GGDEF)-like protein/PAS domain S-box-containing protein
VDAGATILIVDDDPGFRRTISDLLREKGYTPRAAAEGKAALDGLKKDVVSVAVIDLRLQDMSGLEVMKEIKRSSPDTECILLTGHASQESAIEAVNLGAYSYVQKPCDVEQLLLLIRRATERMEAERALRESEQRYRELVEKANDLIYTHDLEGNFTSMNPAARRIYGYSIEEMSELNVADIIDAEYLPVARRKIKEQLQGSPHTGPYELLTRSKAGELIWVEVSTRVLERAGRPYEVQAIARDITERKRTEQALDREKERFGVLVEGSPLGVVTIGQDGGYEYVNSQFVEMFGYTLEDIPTGRDWFRRAYPDEEYRSQVISAWITDLKRSRRGKVRPRTFTVRCKDSSEKVIQFRPVTMESGDQFVVCEDITDRRRAEETIRRLAYHDALTGLPNRTLFDDRLEVALAHARRQGGKLAVMLLDLDRFKDVNDTLGHIVGDELLQAVGARLTTLLRESDTVCRMGGDEFLLLLPGISEAKAAHKVAERILEAIREPFDLNGRGVRVTTSLGIAIYLEDGEDGDTLVENADVAMYHAKQRGRDNYQWYSTSMRQVDTRSLGSTI